MCVFSRVKDSVESALAQYHIENKIFDNITVELPKSLGHGDLSTNAAMVLAKYLKTNPKQLAGEISEYLRQLEYISKVDIAGAGFINMTLTNQAWIDELDQIIAAGDSYGDNHLYANRKVNIEYISANPTGPLHVGHARGAVFGDVFANMLIKSGAEVTKEYLVNDHGNQIDNLVQSVLIRYSNIANNENQPIPEGCYPGSFLIDFAHELYAQFGDDLLHDESKHQQVIRPLILEYTMNIIKKDLQALGVYHDVFRYESDLHKENKIQEAIKIVEDNGYLYRGGLEDPKSKNNKVDQKDMNQLIFASTRFGDDVDRVVLRGDDRPTYFACDVGYEFDKIERGFTDLFMTLGADHAGYVKRIEALVSALSNNQRTINVEIYRLVKFIKDGQKMKMSKRSGDSFTLGDLLDLVGKDSIRFMMLSSHQNAEIDFDIDKVKAMSNDNPVFYVQYAHARACSVIRHINTIFPDLKTSKLSEGYHLAPEEILLIKQLSRFSTMLKKATIKKEPHMMVYYLRDIAAAFHNLWHAGKVDVSLRFIHQDNKELTSNKFVMLSSFLQVIRVVMSVCGITPVEEM